MDEFSPHSWKNEQKFVTIAQAETERWAFYTETKSWKLRRVDNTAH